MTRYDVRVRVLATVLAGLAGFVDATGFLALGGFFVSFMSGNSTRMAVGFSRGSPDPAIAAGIIVTFVVGVVAGSLTGHAFGRYRRPAVLLLVAALLAAAAALRSEPTQRWSAVAMTLAMGAENAVFEHDGDVQIGLTYMTGALVKLGQRFAKWLRGEGRIRDWTPYLLMWLGMLIGAVAGGFAFPSWGVGGLGAAAAVAAILAAASVFSGCPQEQL